MPEQFIEVEADMLEEAKKQAKSQVPQDYCVISEEIISNGHTQCIEAVAETEEAAFAEAEMKVPSGAQILKKEKLNKHGPRIITVEAFDQENAISEAKYRASGFRTEPIFLNLTLVEAGKKGFLGFRKKPARYEVQVLVPAHVSVHYSVAPKIRLKIDERANVVAQLISRLKDNFVRQVNIYQPAWWESYHVRENTIEALDRLGWRPTADVAGAMYWILRERWDECIKLGYVAIEPLIAALRDSNNSVGMRLACFSALEKIPSSNVPQSDVQNLIDSVASEIRHLYSRTCKVEERYWREGYGDLSTPNMPYRVEDTGGWQTIWHEEHDPDVEGIRRLIAIIPETLYHHVREQSGEAKYLFDDSSSF